MQAGAPDAANLPLEHLVHLLAPVFECFPGRHGLHGSPLAEYLPAAHCLHSELPTADEVPPGHCLQMPFGLNLPSMQFVQALAPDLADLPAVGEVQRECGIST